VCFGGCGGGGGGGGGWRCSGYVNTDGSRQLASRWSDICADEQHRRRRDREQLERREGESEKSEKESE
jgi:hypothetical protein